MNTLSAPLNAHQLQPFVQSENKMKVFYQSIKIYQKLNTHNQSFLSSFIHLFIQYIYLIVHLFIHSFIYSFIHSLTHSFIHLFIPFSENNQHLTIVSSVACWEPNIKEVILRPSIENILPEALSGCTSIVFFALTTTNQK